MTQRFGYVYAGIYNLNLKKKIAGWKQNIEKHGGKI